MLVRLFCNPLLLGQAGRARAIREGKFGVGFLGRTRWFVGSSSRLFSERREKSRRGWAGRDIDMRRRGRVSDGQTRNVWVESSSRSFSSVELKG